MIRTFEFDDYPVSDTYFLKFADHLKRRFPDFKCTVFAIPGAMTREKWRPLIHRKDWIQTCPHGIVHQKRECREPDVYSLRMHWLDSIARERRYTKLFKAPWHGLSQGFIDELHERGFEFCHAYLTHRVPFPTPEWRCWMLKDARAMSRAPNFQHVEAHAIVDGRHPSWIRKHQQVGRRLLRRLIKSYGRNDQWRFVSELTAPLLKKVYLGCGPHVLDGWDNLDPRTHLDSRIIRWQAPERLPYIDNRVDIVLTSHMWNYLDDSWYRWMAKEIHRVLRPGGLARLSEDETESGYVWRRPGQRSRGTGTIRSLPTKRKIKFALRRAGFRVRDARPGETRSPHVDVLAGDTRGVRYERGEKYYLEAIKTG